MTLSFASARASLLPFLYARGHYLLMGLILGEGLLFVYCGHVNRDEGWYLYASRLVFEGRVPYRDFPYFLGPVLPYIYGLPQLLAGPSLLVGRLTSLGFTLTAIVTAAYLARRLAGQSALLWCLALAFLNPALMYDCTMARSEGVVTMLAVLGLAALFVFRRGIAGLLVAPALLLLASGVRLVVAPAFVGVLALAWWATPALRRERLLAGAALLAESVILFAVPVCLAPRRAVFGLWSSQASRASQWFPSPDAGATMLAKIGDLESLWMRHLMLIVPAVALTTYVILRYRQGWRPRLAHLDRDPLSACGLTIGIAFLLFVPHVMLSAIDPRYFVPCSALLMVAVAVAAARLPGSPGLRAIRPAFVMLLVMVILLGAPAYAARSTQFLDVRDRDLAEVGRVGDLLASYLDDSSQMVALDTTLAVEADRQVLDGLEMGLSSYWPHLTTDEAARLGVMNRQRLVAAIEANAPRVVALTDWDLALIDLTSPPELAGPPADKPPFAALPELKPHYTLVDTVPRYGTFRDNLYILLRTGP